MKMRSMVVLGCLLALLAGIWLLWSRPAGRPAAARPSAVAVMAANPAATNSGAVAVRNPSVLSTNKLSNRLSNTTQSIGWLMKRPHAVLLENAFIDTEVRQGLKIPDNLKHQGDPGAYIVQARNAPDARFRSVLTMAGAQIVSYIPNNAYLVQISESGAGTLAGSSLVQAVLPYEPYYKIQSSLLDLAMNPQEPLPGGTVLTVALFAKDAAVTEPMFAKLGAQIVGRDNSPFGPILRVEPPSDWTALAQLPGVELVEVAHPRHTANDLSRVTLGISVDTLTNANYLNLSGSNVIVEVNDSGIDATHPDFTIGGSAETGPGTPTRVIGDSPFSLVDTNGHGTFVAGIIAGNGAESYTLNTNEPSGSVTNADFRGKAPLATLFSVGAINGYDPFAISDYYLQAVPAQTNALISNNSWGYGQDGYDLAAASYDAATRDALPFVPGSQSVLFVFAGGNDGGGNDDGSAGNSDSIESPGTAKNVITVGSLEQLRYITNIVTSANSNKAAVWFPETDSSVQVASYSSRGNVGIGTEGTYGRFKPDVVVPGTFVVSTRSSQWDTNSYFSLTNNEYVHYTDQTVATNGLNDYNVRLPANAIGVVITITPNVYTTVFPANMPIYFLQTGQPTTTSYDFTTAKDGAAIPADGGAAYFAAGGFWFAVGDSTNVAVNYDVNVDVLTTNNVGDYYQVLFGMDDTLKPWYRYESGTSMAAAGVSGYLALIQDFFTNQLQTVPSPALMKAMLINGCRPTGGYDYAVTNSINYEGWGLPNIQDSLPYGGTNGTVSTNGPIFFVDQSPTNALATGDSHTYTIYLDTNNYANYLPLQVTLAWTDPPGNPAAAIKLVNGLELVVTNLDTEDVFFGNDLPTGVTYNNPWVTNTVPNIDYINNVQNVFLQPLLGGRYSITVIGRSVNVNAVTAQTNNVVQDYALVVTCGEGEVPTAFTSVTDNGIASNPTGDQDMTFVLTTNSPYFNQMAGASTPLLGTNTLPLGTNTIWGNPGQVVIGMTNQWHFYVITNNYQPVSDSASHVTNAVFLTFLPGTLSVPRMGVFADSDTDSTRPESDIDLFATTDPNLTNLSPVTISNCVNNVGDNKSSLTAGGTEFVYFTDSSPGTVYYVGVQSQDQMAAEYDFMPIFTSTALSQNDHGNLLANGLLLPSLIPDGDPAHPGVTNVFALAIPALAGLDPSMQVAKVLVTNQVWHQNFGDLYGTLVFDGISDVLNNHDGLGNTFGNSARVFDDSRNAITNATVHTDGPGNLQKYIGKSATGPWIQWQIDNALNHTGQITAFSLEITPHQDFRHPGITVTVPPGGWFVDYVDVPVGYEQLILDATNTTIPYATPASQAIQMYEMYNQQPTATSYDQEATLTNCLAGTGSYGTGTYPGNAISTGPPLPPGLYFVGLYNPSTVAQNVFLSYQLIPVPVMEYVTGTSTTPTGITPDMVNDNSILMTSTQQIAAASVGMVIQNIRISDLAITLVNQLTGQRILLMENRGGLDTNGAGSVFIYTNVLNATATGGAAANTNYFDTGNTAGTIPLTYNFYTAPDEMTIYYGTNLTPANLIWDSGMTNNPGQNPITISVTYPPPGATTVNSTYLTIIMNQFGNPDANGDQWTYTMGAQVTNYAYLTFTDDTNLATVPIKYAIPPYQLNSQRTNYTFSDLDLVTNGAYVLTNGTYAGPTNIYDPYGGWTVPTNLVVVSYGLTNGNLVAFTNNVALTNNEVSVLSDPTVALEPGSNYLALANGVITRTLPTLPGYTYNVTYWYRGPGIDGWWRGEGNALDSSDPENNANNGRLVGRFTFPAGEVGQAFGMVNPGQIFVFAGTNAYVQIPQPPLTYSNTLAGTNGTGTNVLVQTSPLDVGTGTGFTVEGWLNPTNLTFRQPLVEWLARVPTNAAVTNLAVKAGPFLSPYNGHYYYLLGNTNYAVSEYWAEQLGGHLATVRTANDENWIYDEFATYGGVNRNLWIGLTNSPATSSFGWESGETNYFANWLTGQPYNPDNTRNFTAILGGTNNPANLWVLADNNGFYGATNATGPATNKFYGVVEVNEIQTNGVQLWVSFTNSVATNSDGTSQLVSTNGCLYANLVDTTNGNHELISAGGLLQTDVFQHVALTYSTNTGVAMLYYNGSNVLTTNLGVFVPKTTGDVLLGKDMSRRTNNAFFGALDEISIYGRMLTPAEIHAIYQESALSTNRNQGKFDPTVTPEDGLAEAVVSINGVTNLIYGFNKQWTLGSYTFTATSNSVPIQVMGLQPGILLDDFAIAQAPLTNLYYQPEMSLSELVGDSAFGEWTLELWDTRTDTNAGAQLVSWQLQFTVQTNPPVVLNPEGLTTNGVPANSITYYSIAVPAWASVATNILVSASSPVDLLFNQSGEPTGSNPGDYELLTNVLSGTNVLYTIPPPPQFLPGQTYYLGVRNNGSATAVVVLSVDFNMVTLTNGVPYTSVLGTNTTTDLAQYYAFNVSSNVYAATFQLLKLSSNADLVVSPSAPLPTLTNSAYGSFNISNANENIYVLSNSAPVPLTAGTWYVGVIRRDSGPVTYSVLAQQTMSNAITVISLTNNVPCNYTVAPGADLSTFFNLAVTDSPPSVHFELYNLSGNGDLTVQTNALPLAPPFLQSSAQRGRTPELIYVATNSVRTNLAANWYLGVPNNETNAISFTILAVEDTNAVFPAFPGAEGTGGGAGDAGGNGTVQHLNNVTNVYHVTSLADAGTNTLRDALTQSNRTVVFDVSGYINLTSGPLVLTNSFLTIAGQTAPGDGITVAGDVLQLQSVHDVVLRYLRFRPGDGVAGDAVQFTNVSNVIADHVSVSWSDNNLVSVLNSTNVTVQWSILADSLYNATNPVNGGSALSLGGGALSFHHNLYADNYSANPQVDDSITLDFVNNVIYNWGYYSGLSGTNDAVTDVNGYTNQLNYVGNYLIAGLNTSWFATNDCMTNIAFWGGTTNTWIFQTNNLIDANTNGLLDGGYTGWSMFTNNFIKTTNRFPVALVGTDDAYLGYARVLDFAGPAMRLRDRQDLGEVAGVWRQQGQFVLTTAVPAQQPLYAYPAWQNTSGDGIPDFWKTTFGLLPLTNGMYNGTPTTNVNFIGYSDLEEYLAWLAGPHALTLTNTPVKVDLRQMSGRSGFMLFAVTNAINGSVYLTNDVLNPQVDPVTGLTNNTVAVFTPSNNVAGYTYFDYYVTNYQNRVTNGLATNDYYNTVVGPVTVTVLASSASVAYAPLTVTNGGLQTNLVPPGGCAWYRVTLPTNAIMATNTLVLAAAAGTLNYTPPVQVNLWWSTNVPPSTNGLTDFELVTNAQTGAVSILGISTTPAVVPGGTYYLGVQNTNNFDVVSVVDVTFDYLLADQPVMLPIPTQVVVAGSTMTVTNTAIDSNLPAVVYTLATNPPAAGAAIDLNGIITWPTTTNDIGTNYLFTTIATDTISLLSATNSFLVIVLPGVTNGVGVTNVVGAGGISWYVVQVPGIAQAATNLLLSAGPPLNLWWSTNLPPSITNATDFELLTNVTAGTNVLTPGTVPALVPGSVYLLGVQNPNGAAVTNVLEVTFKLPPAPLLPSLPDVVIPAGALLTVTNTAQDTNAVTYLLATNPPAIGAGINSSGIITWQSTTNDGGTNYLFTTVATDTVNGLTATNSFWVTVVPPPFIGGIPQTNVVPPGATGWYLVPVPTNALAATNMLLYASLPVNLWWSTNLPPSLLTNAGDAELLTNLTAGTNVLTTATNPPPVLVPGSFYLLGVQNTNATAITNVLAVTFDLAAPIFSISSITPTNSGTTNGYLLTWFAPKNDQFHVLWTGSLPATNWQVFTGVVSCASPASGKFTFFDDGSRSGGLGSNRFYELLLLNSPTNTPPYFLQATPTNRVVPAGTPMTVTNAAGDWNIPAQTLTYSNSFSLTGTNLPVISNQGVITWTPSQSQAGMTNVITTIVTDTGGPLNSVINSFQVIVPALTVPVISSVTVSNNGVTLQWAAPTNEQFQVRWATNLNPPIAWNPFAGTVVSTNGVFIFVDTNATTLAAKFYQLLLP